MTTKAYEAYFYSRLPENQYCPLCGGPMIGVPHDYDKDFCKDCLE